MREGPLAALFRKTEADEAPDTAGSGLDVPIPDGAPSADAPRPQTSAGQEERGAPHPALSGAGAGRGDRAPAGSAGARAPKDRLKQAFSSEIPANMMDRERHGRHRSEPAARPVMDEYEREHPSFSDGPVGQPRIRVLGVGGAGVNAVNRMVEAEVEGVEFLAVNTDQQSLQQSTADITLHIGAEITRGLGSGSDANVGRQAAMEDYDRVKALLKGSDMIFITAGAGGGTGTGAAPIVARIAREVGALTVAIVTKPFGFEGSRRSEQAERGIDALAEEVDTLIVVPNNRLLSVLDKQTAMVEAFRVADDVLRQGVQGISDLVTLPGLINLDFADVRTIMSDAGNALLGIGMGAGGGHRLEGFSAPWTRRCRRSPRRSWKPRWRARARSCCRSPVGVTYRCGRSTRPPRPSLRRRTPTRTSSSARWSMRSSTTRCGSRWSRPATATPSARSHATPRAGCASPRASRACGARAGLPAPRTRSAGPASPWMS